MGLGDRNLDFFLKLWLLCANTTYLRSLVGHPPSSLILPSSKFLPSVVDPLAQNSLNPSHISLPLFSSACLIQGGIDKLCILSCHVCCQILLQHPVHLPDWPPYYTPSFFLPPLNNLYKWLLLLHDWLCLSRRTTSRIRGGKRLNP